MKKCNDCKYAEWDKTKTGRLSPTGDGKCTYKYSVPELPASMYWVSYGNSSPSPSGGYINRRKELSKHCVYYQAKD